MPHSWHPLTNIPGGASCRPFPLSVRGTAYNSRPSVALLPAPSCTTNDDATDATDDDDDAAYALVTGALPVRHFAARGVTMNHDGLPFLPGGAICSRTGASASKSVALTRVI